MRWHLASSPVVLVTAVIVLTACSTGAAPPPPVVPSVPLAGAQAAPTPAASAAATSVASPAGAAAQGTSVPSPAATSAITTPSATPSAAAEATRSPEPTSAASTTAVPSAAAIAATPTGAPQASPTQAAYSAGVMEHTQCSVPRGGDETTDKLSANCRLRFPNTGTATWAKGSPTQISVRATRVFACASSSDPCTSAALELASVLTAITGAQVEDSVAPGAKAQVQLSISVPTSVSVGAYWMYAVPTIGGVAIGAEDHFPFLIPVAGSPSWNGCDVVKGASTASATPDPRHCLALFKNVGTVDWVRGTATQMAVRVTRSDPAAGKAYVPSVAFGTMQAASVAPGQPAIIQMSPLAVPADAVPGTYSIFVVPVMNGAVVGPEFFFRLTITAGPP